MRRPLRAWDRELRGSQMPKGVSSSRVRAEQSRALLSVTLYGCTDNCIYREQAHGIIDSWRTEERPKKIKAQLIRRLDDYDEWLGHRR